MAEQKKERAQHAPPAEPAPSPEAAAPPELAPAPEPAPTTGPRDKAPATEARPGEVRLERSYRLSLNVGARMMLRFGLDDDSALDFVGELIGYSYYEFMLVRVQPVPGLLPRIKQGERVHVRFLSDGEAAIFQTSIISHLTRPVLLLALAYPQTMKTVQVRKHKRLCCALPVWVGKSEQRVRAIISDISRGGCRLALDMRGNSASRSLAPGAVLDMELPLSLSLQHGLEKVQARVKSVETEQHRMILGLCFEPMPTRTAQLLETFLANTEVLIS